MFLKPEEVKQKEKEYYSSEEYKNKKQVIIDTINQALQQEKIKGINLTRDALDIFEREEMKSKLENIGWKLDITYPILSNFYCRIIFNV